ncbi:Flp family type IVb pilin [Sphingomonas endolithica]|uniref:Flp family type IVb pilin n=1 Tax=Sphingomonas endolithica TaxID=2972485 RepID=UPI0021AFA172|nr:Flp family type IVb pilin [Sphingomonas sp. ZFBP2030]
MIARFMKKLARDHSGGTAIEYGLIAALIVIAMIASLAEVANTTTTMWNGVNTKVDRAVTYR